MKHVWFSVLLLMAINLLNLNWLQAEDKEASPFVWVDKAAEAYRAGKVKAVSYTHLTLPTNREV